MVFPILFFKTLQSNASLYNRTATKVEENKYLLILEGEEWSKEGGYGVE